MVQGDIASNGDTGSGSGRVLDLDDDEENAKPWKQGDASKQVCSLPFTNPGSQCRVTAFGVYSFLLLRVQKVRAGSRTVRVRRVKLFLTLRTILSVVK